MRTAAAYLRKAVAAVLLLVLVAIAIGGLMSALSGKPPLRGRMVDIGGRSLRLVCAGPETSPHPLVLMEAGAFGFAADWSAVQDRLSERGFRSCAYDRAGAGFSDPGPGPRDGAAVADDFQKLISAAGLHGPFILVGHSMAGLYLRLHAARLPGQLKGLVLVDAATPEGMAHGAMRGFVKSFSRASHLAGLGASAGLFKPLAPFMGDRIGVAPEAVREKKWAFSRGPHNRNAADEVRTWPQTAEQAGQTPPYDPEIPVAVVSAGGAAGSWKGLQQAPARASRQGSWTAIAGSQHATLLGRKYGGAIADAVQRVAEAK
jgi:pimeloyl-ACP methyl ester carboxylesterase